MNYNIGDIVSIIDDNIEGKIIKILPNNNLLIEIDFGNGLTNKEIFPINKVTPKIYEKDYKNHLSYILHTKTNLKNYPQKEKIKNKKCIEIDLHIEAIESKYNIKIDKNKYLERQKTECINAIEKCIANKIPQLIIIHGVGDGILRNEIIKIISSYDNIIYQDAPYKKYGKGAILLTIKKLFEN